MAVSTLTDLILSDVRSAVDDFTAASDIRVSPQAVELIASVLAAFLFDPHPNWHAGRLDHTDYFNAHLARIPDYLKQISTRLGERQEITSFDVLAWFSENLRNICDYACPF